MIDSNNSKDKELLEAMTKAQSDPKMKEFYGSIETWKIGFKAGWLAAKRDADKGE